MLPTGYWPEMTCDNAVDSGDSPEFTQPILSTLLAWPSLLLAARMFHALTLHVVSSALPEDSLKDSPLFCYWRLLPACQLPTSPACRSFQFFLKKKEKKKSVSLTSAWASLLWGPRRTEPNNDPETGKGHTKQQSYSCIVYDMYVDHCGFEKNCIIDDHTEQMQNVALWMLGLRVGFLNN